MRLIDADAIQYTMLYKENWLKGTGVEKPGVWKDTIDAMPTIEPERKKGKWQITDAYPHNVYCSECHTRFAQTHWAVWEDGSLPRNFCPNCGADMREDQHDQSK